MRYTTVKISDDIIKRIDETIQDPTLGFESRTHFVLKAIEKEFQEITIKKQFDETGRIFFDDIWRMKRMEAFRETHWLMSNQKRGEEWFPIMNRGSIDHIRPYGKNQWLSKVGNFSITPEEKKAMNELLTINPFDEMTGKIKSKKVNKDKK